MHLTKKAAIVVMTIALPMIVLAQQTDPILEIQKKILELQAKVAAENLKSTQPPPATLQDSSAIDVIKDKIKALQDKVVSLGKEPETPTKPAPAVDSSAAQQTLQDAINTAKKRVQDLRPQALNEEIKNFQKRVKEIIKQLESETNQEVLQVLRKELGALKIKLANLENEFVSLTKGSIEQLRDKVKEQQSLPSKAEPKGSIPGAAVSNQDSNVTNIQNKIEEVRAKISQLLKNQESKPAPPTPVPPVDSDSTQTQSVSNITEQIKAIQDKIKALLQQ